MATVNGVLVLARAIGLGSLVASQISVLLVTAVVWFIFFACYISQPIPPSAKPRNLAILGDPSGSIRAKLRATFTNWFSLLSIASQLLLIASLVLF